MIKILKKIRFLSIFWFFFYLFLFFLLVNWGFDYLDPDFGWHLKVGQEISFSSSVPHLNTYNYTYTGNWVDHEWLSNFFIYRVYSFLGYPSLVFGFAFLIIFCLILLNIGVKKLFPNRSTLFLVIFFQVFGVIASLPHFGVRIQELAPFFLLIILGLIYYYNKNKNWSLLLALPPIFYLWSCLHASFLIGFFIIFFWVVVKLAEIILSRFKKLDIFFDSSQILNYKEILIFLFFSIVSLAATFFTPYRGELYSFLGGYTNTIYLSYIIEWVSQFSFPFNYYQLIYLSLTATAFLLYIISVINKKYFKLNLWSLFIVIVFLFLSFKSRRHFPLLFVSSFFFIIEVYSTYLEEIKFKTQKWLNFYLILCLLLASIWQITKISFITRPFESFCRDYPCAAIDFLKGHSEYDKDRLFNEYGWGGFLIYVYPERKIFIDGRLPQVAYAGHSFLEEYLPFMKKDGAREKKLKEYDISLVLTKAKDNPIKIRRWEKIFFNLKESDFVTTNFLREYLASSSDWKLVFKDELSVVYARKK